MPFERLVYADSRIVGDPYPTSSVGCRTRRINPFFWICRKGLMETAIRSPTTQSETGANRYYRPE
jgi:hypothetical protein